MFGCEATACVTSAANRSRSTANAAPAATRAASPHRMTSDPSSFISCFSSPTAFVGADERNELEQTSSARFDVWCAAVVFAGRISKRSTLCPLRASANANSHPARPAPTILTRDMGLVRRLVGRVARAVDADLAVLPLEDRDVLRQRF